MRILMMGGGIFVGRALIEAALARGHQITAFSRGRNPFPYLDRISIVTGDRNIPADLKKLISLGPWDAIVDTSAYRPRQVRLLLETLGASTRLYTFISSISAYANLAQPNIDETASLALSSDLPDDVVTAQNYGPLKADCEREAATFPRTLIIRPGIIAGPYDPTDRLAYWIEKIRKAETLTIPNDMAGAPVQLIDARDLATWTLSQIEDSEIGTFNAVNPSQPITCNEMFHCIADSLGCPLHLQSARPEDLSADGVQLKKDFPFYVPAGLGADGLFQINGRKAWEKGLVARPLIETVRDCAIWFAENRVDEPKPGWTNK